MINVFFFLAVLVGFALRTLDGRIISIAVGLCIGILLNELWKFAVWLHR